MTLINQQAASKTTTLRLNHRERFQVGPMLPSKPVVKSNKNITVAGFQSFRLFRTACVEYGTNTGRPLKSVRIGRQRFYDSSIQLNAMRLPVRGKKEKSAPRLFFRLAPGKNAVCFRCIIAERRFYPSPFSLPSFSAIDSCDCPGLRKNAAPNAARISYNSQALYGWYK